MKRIAALILAVILTIGMTTAAFAANNKITKQIKALDNVDAGERGPGYEIWLPLKKEAFDGATEDLKMTDVKTSKIEVKKTNREGSKAIESVTIKEGAGKVAGIVVKLVEVYTTAKPMDFEVDVHLTIGGKNQGLKTTVFGSLANDSESIYADDDYVDLSEGITAVCEETTKDRVETYIGEGISIFVRMTKGKEYYGTVSRDVSDADIKLLDKYPEVEEIFTVSTVNLNPTGDMVKINYPYEAQVYGKDMKYLGTTEDMLPYSTKYYLAASNLDEAEDESEYVDEEEPEDEPEDDFEPEYEPEVETGTSQSGGTILPAVGPAPTGSSNGNNPDTGAGNPFLGVAAAAMMASLAAIGTLAIKKK